jgi:glycosyltransferase involved in cell wall biosynthesis
MSDVINVSSPNWDPCDSYGQLAVRLVYHLTKAGQHVNAFGTGDVIHPAQSEAVQALLRKPIKPVLGGLVMGYPTSFGKYGPLANNGPRVAVTMFESTKLPDGWVQALNQCRAVIVPSRWLVPVFCGNGVKVPVHVVPLGISETYQFVKRPAGRKPFTFLTMGDRFRRKGWDLTVLAFNKAFGQNPNYKLIIKARADGMKIDIAHPCIEILRQDMTEAEMQALYARADAYVFATRGEGFGLPPREAAATGLPVIATKWGGTADDLTAWGYPLRCTMVPAWQDNEQMRGLGKWAEPDLDHLVEQMQYVSSGNPMIAHMGEESARRIRRLYDWQRFANGVLKVWQDIINPTGVKNRVDAKKIAKVGTHGNRHTAR